MKKIITLLCICLSLTAFAQSNPKAIVRQQTFGVYTSFESQEAIKFDTSDLVVFMNGYRLTKDELLTLYALDSAVMAKATYLDKYVTSYKRAFEAMEQGLDTTTKFQLDYLTHKQELITPYLNEGKTRAEAEALPSVKYSLRRYYVQQLEKLLLKREVYVFQSDDVLRDYYNDHLSLYQGQSFEISKTKVIFDSQKEKEKSLNTRIDEHVQLRKNDSLIKSL
jgi:hypothetical protein